MDMNKLPLFAALTAKMDWLQERQKVLAQNIANSNTPGYQPRDLEPVSFRDLLRRSGGGGGRLQPAATDARHLAATSGRPAGAVVQKGKYETTPSGNAVALEEELMKVAQTQIEFTTTSNLYRKHVALIKAALGKR